MKCPDFMEWVDAKADRGEIPAKSRLPEEISEHIEGCESCAEYYADMVTIHGLLLKMERAKESPELRESLLSLVDSNRRESPAKLAAAIAPMVMKISVPAILVWLAATFLAPGLVPIVETLLLLVVLVPMFEKIGRRMITDRV